VLAVGDLGPEHGELLLQLGARSVHLFDVDESRARAQTETVRGLTIKPWGKSDFEFRDGAFDAVLVFDLPQVGEHTTFLPKLRRVADRRGVVVITSPASGPSAIEYTELYDAVSLEFPHVEVLGGLPWRGTAFARFGAQEEELEVSVDAQLVTTAQSPEFYVLVGTEQPTQLQPFALVQLPEAEQAETETLDTANFAEAQLRAELLSAQLEEQRVLSQRLSAEVDKLKVAGDAPGSEAAQLRLRAEQAEARAQQEFSRAERLVQNARELGEALRAQRDENERLERQLKADAHPRATSDVDALARTDGSGPITQEPVEIRVLPMMPRITDVETTVSMHGDDLASLADEFGAERVDSPDVETVVHKSTLALRARAADDRALAAEDKSRLLAEELSGLKSKLTAAEQALDSAQSARGNAELAQRKAEEGRAKAELQAQEAQRAQQAADELRGKLEEALRAARQPSATDQAFEQENISLETKLRERGGRVAELDAELSRRERMIQELVLRLEDAEQRALEPQVAAAPATAPATEASAALQAELASLTSDNEVLRRKLDALALELARFQGELFARDWRISELEQNLALTEANVPSPPRSEAPPPRASVHPGSLLSTLGADAKPPTS
jgi:hypothetical protein